MQSCFSEECQFPFRTIYGAGKSAALLSFFPLLYLWLIKNYFSVVHHTEEHFENFLAFPRIYDNKAITTIKVWHQNTCVVVNPTWH